MEKSTVLESLITEVMCGYFREENNTCGCTNCRKYITTMMLERLSPKYAEMLKNKAEIRVQVVDNQLKADIMREFLAVVNLRKSNPQAKPNCTNNK